MNEPKTKYLPYLALKKEMYQCFLVSRGDYYREKVKHDDWPPNPDELYKEEWDGWEEFLGLNRKVFFTPYKLLVVAVRKSGIKTIPDYIAECKKNSNWPFNPENAFASEWEGWYKFFDIEIGSEIKEKERKDVYKLNNIASS